MFPDCDSSNIVIDFHDHLFINNETAGACFPIKPYVFECFPKNQCLETYANQFDLLIQDLPKDTNILIHGSGKRYNYCCFEAWTMLAASNAFIILHDHDFITTKSQEAVLLIKPTLFQWFHKTTCQKRMNIDVIWVSQWIKKAYDYCCFSSFVMFQK